MALEVKKSGSMRMATISSYRRDWLSTALSLNLDL